MNANEVVEKIKKHLNDSLVFMDKRCDEVRDGDCPNVGKQSLIAHIGGASEQTKRTLKYIEEIEGLL